MFLLVFYLFLALFISFLCSVMESVLLSAPLSFLKVREGEGSTNATAFIRLKENIERPLSAILSLNTIAHTIGAAGVGAQAVKLFGDIYFGIISAVLTLLILIFSEIIPKTIGARYWRKLAMASAIIIRGMIVLTYPLVIMTGYISRLFAQSSPQATVSREEISAMANLGAEEGVFDEKELRIIQSLVKLKNVKVSEVMTPRVVVTVADENMSLQEFLAQKEFLFYSRIPVYREHRDQITGYVLRQTVFERLAEQAKGLRLLDIKRDIVIIHEFQTLLNVWEILLDKREYIGLVVDEYGGMDGIVTMEDIVETILGLEIVDERDRVTDMQEYALERWKARRTKYNILWDSDQNSILKDKNPDMDEG
jgi:CBS domain containing-hemolysin-like protein